MATGPCRELLTAAMDERSVQRETAKDVGGELLLRIAPLERLVPIDWCELEYALRRPARQETEEVAQVGPRLDLVQSTAGEQRNEGGIDVAGVVVAEEEPVAPVMQSFA